MDDDWWERQYEEERGARVGCLIALGTIILYWLITQTGIELFYGKEAAQIFLHQEALYYVSFVLLLFWIIFLPCCTYGVELLVSLRSTAKYWLVGTLVVSVFFCLSMISVHVLLYQTVTAQSFVLPLTGTATVAGALLILLGLFEFQERPE